ncbi:uncharacterized protein LOC126907827 [Daktulosphaira vitifoliae]|uniref:uncharacterized protein LOC126907827 n=1 Tax=Daktulosphaira vitifoliae TaxID=58002 RepID=UPI0021A9DB30|nr:uncharacterized protein LOC126907827 [Daktulosphaira vitifoliae]
MSASLDTLSSNLLQADKSKFESILSSYQEKDLDLVFRKGVFCYEWMDDWSKLSQTSLPSIEEFYSSLSEKHISTQDYEHAQNVWKRFNHKTMRDYCLWYNKLDVLLLCDVFEAFRDLCHKTYGLDPCYYYTAPGLSFDAMLKITNVELELLSDYDMLLFMENGIRGGLTQAVKRYSKANNPQLSDYNTNNPTSWIIYLDATNLYGWAMSQPLPRKHFNWYEGDLSINTVSDLLENTDSNSDTGYMLEVDIDYPKSLHDAHSDLPYLSEKFLPPGSIVPKLCATLINKNNYIVHYSTLKQAMDAGLKLKKVHRILQFEPSAWLSKYIKLNTDKQKIATSEFLKKFYKLMNNAVFGKTMESCRKRMKMNLVTNEKTFQRLVNKPNFKDITIYDETFCAVHLNHDVITFDKPIYAGFSILEISKTLMYDFHYNTMRKFYGKSIELIYMDTDSLVYLIHTDDFYEDLLKKPGFLQKLDTSNLDPNHKCYNTERTKLPGTFTDEALGKIIEEFIALRSKSYGYTMDSREKIKAKGVGRHVTTNHLTMMDHKQCLFRGMTTTHIEKIDENYTPEREITSFRSYQHRMKTIQTRKLALNRYDDKRVVLSNQIDTLPHGHYMLEKLRIEGKLAFNN